MRVIRPGDETLMGGVVRDGHLIDAACPPDADVIVLQRPCNQKLAEAVPLLVAKGVKVIVDLDDDLAHIHPSNPAFWALHPSKNAGVNWAHAAYAARHASLVTVSTAALVPIYGSHGRVRVLPNRIPKALLDRPRVDADWLGWAGSLHTHPGDLDDIGGAVQRLGREGHEFRVVGDATGVGRPLGMPADPPGTGVIEFADWTTEVAKIGVGVAPLADTRFNHGKSNLRILNYAATGVPWVGTDLPEQRALAEEGCGQVVKPREWYRALKPLLTNPGMRDEWSEKGRAVAANHTYESNWGSWADAWLGA